jgi:hypothetical protein
MCVKQGERYYCGKKGVYKDKHRSDRRYSSWTLTISNMLEWEYAGP